MIKMENKEIEKILKKAGCPTRYLTADFSNYQVYNEKQGKCAETIKSAGDKWLCLTGNTGTGKTHLAISLMREKIKANNWLLYTGIYSDIKKIIDSILAADFARKAEIIRNLSEANFLIIDEIGRSIETKYFQDFIFEVLNNRYNEYKQTVIISNLNKEELFGKYFDEAVSRRISEMGEVINFDWQFYKEA